MRRAALSPLLAVLALASPAFAQDDPSDAPPETMTAESLGDLPHPSVWEGGGIRVTDGTVLHTGAEVSSGYQTNVFYQDPDDGPSGPIGSAIARFSGSASYGTIDAQRAEALAPGSGTEGPRLLFDINAVLTWVQYLSGRQELSNQSDLGIGLNADVKINPTGRLTLDVRDAYVRSVTPGQSLREDLDRDRNELSARLAYRPGGGAIETYFNYSFIVDVFESSITLFEDRLSHTFAVGASWRWLPKTLISVESSYGFVTPSDTTLKSQSTPLRVTAGVSSLVTPVFGFILRGGYANGFYANGANVSTYLVVAEARLAIGPTLRTAAGYSHDFGDALIGNAYTDHAFYARAGWQALDRLQIRASAELRLRSYTGIVDTPTLDLCGDAGCGNFRDDVLARVEVGAEVQIRPWLFAGAGYSLVTDSTDFFVRSFNAVDSGAYVANELFAKVAARF